MDDYLSLDLGDKWKNWRVGDPEWESDDLLLPLLPFLALHFCITHQSSAGSAEIPIPSSSYVICFILFFFIPSAYCKGRMSEHRGGSSRWVIDERPSTDVDVDLTWWVFSEIGTVGFRGLIRCLGH